MCVAERMTLHPVPQRIGFGPYSFQLQFVEPDRQVLHPRQHLGPDSVLHPELVLVKAHSPPVMHLVLDYRPVIADQLGYLVGNGSLQARCPHWASGERRVGGPGLQGDLQARRCAVGRVPQLGQFRMRLPYRARIRPSTNPLGYLNEPGQGPAMIHWGCLTNPG